MVEQQRDEPQDAAGGAGTSTEGTGSQSGEAIPEERVAPPGGTVSEELTQPDNDPETAPGGRA
jgi:hypothetical protein